MELISIIFYFIFMVLISGGGFAVYLIFLKPSPKAHLLKKIGDTYHLVKTVKFKLNQSSLKYRNKTYLLDTKISIVWKKAKPHIFFDIDDMKPLDYKENKIKYDPQMFQTLTDNSMLKNIFGKDQEKIMIIIILILVIGLLISVAFNFYVISNPEAFITTIDSNSTDVTRISPIG